MKTKSLSLKNGTLELKTIHNGQLVLGTYKGARTYPFEILKVLRLAGITHGYIENSLALIQSGVAGQLLLAKAQIEDEPGQVEFLFEANFSDETLIDFVRGGSLENKLFEQRVAKDEPLIKALGAPRKVLRYPDGHKEAVKVLAENDLNYYAGENTRIDREANALLSNIEGYATKDLYGVVKVVPLSQVKSLGKAHGRVYFESAVEVEADVRTESDLEAESTIMINGVVRSGRLESAGNIIAAFGLDNPQKLEMAQARSAGSFITNSIRNYSVAASNYLIAKSAIENSQISCLNTIAVPRIKDSEIRVGNKLFVRSVDKGVKIFIGPDTVSDFRFEANVDFQKQHKKGLMDIEKEMTHIRDRMFQDRKVAMAQLTKLKRISPDMIANDLLLNRYYNNHLKEIKELDNHLKLYQQQNQLVVQDKVNKNFYEDQLQKRANAEIMVLDNLAQGTVIKSRNHTLKIESTQVAVKIIIDQFSGAITTENL